MIKLLVFDGAVESNIQNLEHGINRSTQTIDGYEFLEEVLDSSGIEAKQLVIYNIKLDEGLEKDIINQIRDKNNKVCVFLSLGENDFLDNDRYIASINQIHLMDKPINSQVKGFCHVLKDRESGNQNDNDRVLKLVSKSQSVNIKQTALLTLREVEIMNYLSKGMLYKEIAKNMDISFQTVKSHLKHIYPKLKVSNRTEATLKFLQSV